ncbi:ankyrin repeat domain-containing protein [Candidatus Mesenet endosymbiont of Phosphuga atrata]|uniref:ankyrin repeat domain-containing protein n=1 Tax=Candidatus Mesenet endosymbiont of Phosphuga atrata TaxID=3066221 RepID=UPI0030D2A527
MLLNERFIQAAEDGDMKNVQLFLSEGADIYAKGFAFRETPLHLAAYYGRKEVVELFLNMGVDVNIKNENKMIPLHRAAYMGHKEVVWLLLERGSDVYVSYSNGEDHFALIECYDDEKEESLEIFFLFLLFGLNENKQYSLRYRIEDTPKLKNCLAAFKQIKAMPHLGKLIEANIKKEGAQVIASYINNEAEGQELIEEFEVIKEKYGSNGELSFIPGCLLYVIKNMIFTFLKFYDREKSIITDFGNSINADTVTKEGTNVQRYLPEEVLKEIFSYLDSNEQKNVMLALSEKAYVLLSKLKDVYQSPNTSLAESQLKGIEPLAEHQHMER